MDCVQFGYDFDEDQLKKGISVILHGEKDSVIKITNTQELWMLSQALLQLYMENVTKRLTK